MKAAIFDMDGLLIDSEPLWRLAEKEVFGQIGISLTDEMCEEMMGRRTDEVVAHWYKLRPWHGKSLEDVERELIERMKELTEMHGVALEGVYDILDILQGRGFKLALASSSPHVLIGTVVNKLYIRQYFEVLCSAIDEKFGKPHPAIYLTTAERLGVHPSDCVVFEDSVTGIRSAKAAGMMAIAVPAMNQYGDRRFAEADLKFKSLSDFSLDMVGDL
jgi:sugar-phosphatase